MGHLSEEQMKKTYFYSVDLIKFMSSLMIVYYHRYIIGYERFTYPFTDAWIFVELFLMVTGYFTYCHFLRSDDPHIVQYTLSKIKRLMPYVVFTVLASYLCVNLPLFCAGDLYTAVSNAKDLPAELLLMRALIKSPDQMIFYCGNLWYLSALLVVLPVFCLLCEKCRKYILPIAFVYCPVYYIYTGASAVTLAPRCLLRTLAGLLAGVLIYHLSAYVRAHPRFSPVVYTLAEGMLLASVFVGLYLNCRNFENYVMAFILFLTIVFSQRAIQLPLRPKAANLLGELSAVIFVTHALAFNICKTFLSTYAHRDIAYYLLAIVIAGIAYGIQRGVSHRRQLSVQ